jgi:hypothetical protein
MTYEAQFWLDVANESSEGSPIEFFNTIGQKRPSAAVRSRPLDADKIAAALSLVKAGLSPTAAAKQLGLGFASGELDA